jgi:type I restriction enzyme R subunit
MMAFNEQNTVEHFIIHQLTGVNLNAVRGNMVKEDAVEYDTVKWKYTQADLLQRDITEVFVEKELKMKWLELPGQFWNDVKEIMRLKTISFP